MKTLLCVGDSHSRLIGAKPPGSSFRYGRISSIVVNGFDTANVVSIKGATAAGFYPKIDRKAPFNRVKSAIRRLDPQVVCFGFGQVDTELSCYFMALRDEIRVEDALETRLRALSRYLDSCLEVAGQRHVIVKGLNTSTIQDAKSMRRMLNRRIRIPLKMSRDQFSEKIECLGVSLERHWKINADFSDRLRQEAEAYGLPYFDLREVTGVMNTPGLSKPEYCIGGGDVHLRHSSWIENQFGQALASAENSLSRE